MNMNIETLFKLINIALININIETQSNIADYIVLGNMHADCIILGNM